MKQEAVFVFNNAFFSISRIITGQLGTYADIGNRLPSCAAATTPELHRDLLSAIHRDL
jgi:hypothetical protein